MAACGKSIKIVGAGVAGLTLAAELTARGCAVDVYDKGETAGAASCSRYAGGMLAPWCELESAEEPVARLGAEAADWWERHAGNVTRRGSLVVAQPRDTAELARFASRTRAFEWIEGARIGEIEPDLSGRFRKALFFPREAHLNPREALAALAARVTEKGARLHFNADGLEAGKADITVDARGFSARAALSGLRGVKGEMLIVKTPEIALSRPVRMLHPRIPLYIVPRPDGHFMVGATMIESAGRGRITARSTIELLSGAYALHPAFGEAEIVETGADVRPAFANNLPRIVKRGNTYHLNGLYRHGFLLAPALARMAAHTILDGGRPEFLIEEEEDTHETDRQRTVA